MARPAATYRAARKADARARGQKWKLIVGGSGQAKFAPNYQMMQRMIEGSRTEPLKLPMRARPDVTG